jgi:hypothetical protein
VACPDAIGNLVMPPVPTWVATLVGAGRGRSQPNVDSSQTTRSQPESYFQQTQTSSRACTDSHSVVCMVGCASAIRATAYCLQPQKAKPSDAVSWQHSDGHDLSVLSCVLFFPFRLPFPDDYACNIAKYVYLHLACEGCESVARKRATARVSTRH